MKDFFRKIETILKIFVLMVLAIFATSIVVDVTDSALAGIIFIICVIIFPVVVFYYEKFKNIKEWKKIAQKHEQIETLKAYSDDLDSSRLSQKQKDKHLREMAKIFGIKL